MPIPEETLLTGGYSNVVSRRGDTVRRNVGPWTPTVHALLRHLPTAGFTLAPEPLGIDEHGREVLNFIEGQPAMWPWPEILQRDQGLRLVARLVRDLGQALKTFPEAPDAIWHGGPRSQPDHVIRHGDLAPWNTLWDGDRLVGLIDWDTAEPAPPGWDMAQGAWLFVPLRPMTGYRADAPSFTIEVRAHRLAVWCEELGVEPADLLSTLDDVQRFERDRIQREGEAGVEPYATFLARGSVEEIDQERDWLAVHREELLSR